MLKRPNFALNPARTVVARETDFRSVAVWPFDRDVDEPWCSVAIQGVSLLGLFFASDDQLWTFTTDGTLTAWSIADVLAAPPDDADDADDVDDVDDADDADNADDADDADNADDDKAAETPHPTKLWEVRLNATFAAFEAADDRVALGDDRGRVWLVESTPDGARVFVGNERHGDAVLTLAFSRDRSQIASSGRDRAIRIWRKPGAGGLTESSVVTTDDVVQFFTADDPAGVSPPPEAVSPSEVLDFFSVAEDGSDTDSPDTPDTDSPDTPDTDAPDTEAPDTEAPDTDAPDTDAPDTDAPDTDSPNTEAPDTEGNRPSELECVRTFHGMDGWQLALAFSSDDLRLASGGMDHGVYLWDLRGEDDQPVNVQFAHSGWIADVEWSPGNDTIATASWDSTIGLFDGSTLEPKLCLELHRDYVSDVEFVGDRLIAGSHDTEISAWDWRQGKLERVLTGHADWVEAIQPLEGDRLASIGSDGTIRLWDIDREELLRTIGHVDGAGIELGSAVGFSDYVDTTELASYGVSATRERSSRYRNYRASGFRSGTQSNAVGLLEGALGSAGSATESSPAPSTSLVESSAADPSVEFVEASRPVEAPSELELATPAPEVELPEASIPEPRLDLDASPSKADLPEADLPDSLDAEEEPPGSPDTASPDTDPPDTDSPNTDSPDTDSPDTDPPDTDSPDTDSPDTDPPDTDSPDTDPPDTDPPALSEQPETPDQEGLGEAGTSVSGPNVITSYDAGESLETLTMSLASDSTARLESNDPPEEIEPVSEPPSVEMPGNIAVSGLAEPSVDEGWDILEQTVDASVFGTEKWREPSRTGLPPLEDESSPEDWIREGSIVDQPPSMQHDETDRKTREVPTDDVIEMMGSKELDVTDTDPSEIWERLPSRSTPTAQILKERARIGSTQFDRSHSIRTPHEFVYSVAVAPDGQRIATCGGDNSVCIWTRSGDLLHRMKVRSDGLNSVAFSFDGRAVVAGGDDCRVHLWLLPTSQDSVIRHAPMRGHDGWISSVAFSDEASFVLTGSYDGTARVWKLSSGQCVRTLGGHDGAVAGVAIGKTRAYTVGHDGALSVWNQKWVQVDLIGGHDRLLSVSSNGDVTAFCAANGEVFLLRDGRDVPLMRHRGQARAVRVRGDGAVFSVGEDGSLRIYPPGSETPTQSLTAGSPLWCVDASNNMICAGADDGMVYVFTDES
jgi:WD40 repeat protein